MGKITREKKGIFFTFIAITIMAVFILIFTPPADISLQKNTQAIRARISSVDGYVSDLEDRYFENVLRASTSKTILALVSYVEVKKIFLTDLNSAFSEVIKKGTINGLPIDDEIGKTVMKDNTLNDWSKKIKDTAKDTLKVDTKITINSVSVSPKNSWEIESQMELSFTVKALDNVAEWTKENIIIKTTVGIEGFDDPYSFVKTNGVYKNTIKKSNVGFNQWDLAKVEAHLRDNNYTHWQDSNAPDFLMRLTGALSPSLCCGIESFVNPAKLSPPDKDKNEIYIDYKFWDPSSNPICPTPQDTQPELYRITALPSQFNGFKLDFENVVKYNLQDNAFAC